MPIDFNLLKTMAGHGYDVNAVAFSRDGKLLASGGGDRTVRVWSVVNQQQLHAAEHGEWINAVSFAPSGQAVASGARDGSVKLWGVETAQLFGTIQAHAQNVSSVAFSPDGRRLASAGGDGRVRVFNLREKKIERDVAAHSGWVWSVVFSSLGDRLLTAGADGAARIFSTETGAPIVGFQGHEEDVLAAALSADDRLVATAGKDGTLRLWAADSGRQLVSTPAHEGAVNAVAFSPDGQYIVTAGADHVVNVWGVETLEKARELTGHQDYVASVVFSRDGKLLASCGGDGTVKIWEATERSAYGSDSQRDPNLVIERDEATERAEAYTSVYAAGKVLADTALKNGIRISLMLSARDKYGFAVGEAMRTAVTVADDQVNVMSSNGSLLFKYDVSSQACIYDRTGGTAAPWVEGRDPAGAAEGEVDPNLERGGTAAAGSAFGGSELEIERGGGAGGGYQSFERLGKSLARERLGTTGHTLRFVRFDEDTLYVLFDRAEEPTMVFKGEHLDVRAAGGKPLFRLNLRSLEPVISRKGDAGAEPEPEPEAERDPLLVHGLNEMDAGAGPKVNRVLEKAVWSHASDVHIPSGAPVLVRRYGLLQPLGTRTFPPDEIAAMANEILTPEQQRVFAETNDLDFSYEIPNVGRFRGNVCRQHRGVDMTFRAIPDAIPEASSLGLPDSVLPLVDHHNGLVLITGPAGQGKSTTIACLIDRINSARPLHIITVEDPIEFVHPIKRGVVNQREVGRHTLSFANALRAALREDPDVIVVGEMRDLETISLAITASETGHLVFGSLMTSSASQTIDRILDSFPAAQQSQIRTMVSESLRGVVSQQLVPNVTGDGRVLACEVLLGTPAVANLVREKKTFQLPSILQTSRNVGMQRMDDALADLVQAGRISAENAVRYAQDAKAMETRLRPKAAAPEPGARR